jgi:hypothetical protein
MTEIERAEKKILKLLDQGDLLPSEILNRLSASFDDITLREALLNLVTQQQTEWRSGRRLRRRRRRELANG